MKTFRNIFNLALAVICLAGCAVMAVGIAARCAVVAVIELSAQFWRETQKHFAR